MNKTKIGILIYVLLCIVFLIVYELANERNPNTAEVKKIDINSKLPYTLQVEESDLKPESIAYRIWFDFMNKFERDGSIADARFTRFTKLSGDDHSFVAAVVFEVQLPEGAPKTDYGWGEMQDDRVVPNIVWKLTIKKSENLKYSLTNIEKTTDTQIGLPPVESMEGYQKKAGIEEPSENMKYEIKDEKLRVTYDNGKSWKTVPAALQDLFGIGYNGSKQQLMKDSYIITPEKTVFVLEENAMNITKLRVLISSDKGESWNKVLVSDQLPILRLRILGFTSDKDGYLIVTGDKTMSWEANFVFKTNDGGQSWQNIGPVDNVTSLVTDGGFINDQLGFISFGEYRYENQSPIPNLYRTADGGGNWERVQVPIPEEYMGYFTIAEIPTFHGAEGTLLVNQGPSGDYLGGKVLAKFTSEDQGKTWSFAGLVDPDGVLHP